MNDAFGEFFNRTIEAYSKVPKLRNSLTQLQSREILKPSNVYKVDGWNFGMIYGAFVKPGAKKPFFGFLHHFDFGEQIVLAEKLMSLLEAKLTLQTEKERNREIINIFTELTFQYEFKYASTRYVYCIVQLPHTIDCIHTQHA